MSFILAIFLSLFFSFILTLLLYYRETKSSYTAKQKKILAVFRFFSISLIILLLFSLVFKIKEKRIENPVIVFAQDNSQSIINNKDSTYYAKEYPKDIEKLKKSLSNYADVFIYEFGEKFSEKCDFSYSHKQTDISQVLLETSLRYENRNFCALILATDGIVNTGFDPLTIANNINFPIITVALGDTSIYPDLIIEDIRHNKSVAPGNRFPVEILINAKQLNNRKTNLIIKQNNEEVFRKEISVNSENYYETTTTMLEAKTKESIRLDIEILPFDNEINKANNKAYRLIDVIDQKNEILILYATPHPDISALKSALETSLYNNLTVKNLNKFDLNTISKYDLSVLYQIPNKNYNTVQLIDKIKENNIPILFTVGISSDIVRFNQLNTGLRIISGQHSPNQTLSSYNYKFISFILNESTIKKISSFPPLISHYGKYETQEVIDVLLYQKIGNVTTQNPMVFSNTSKHSNIAVIIGEGLYKWKIYDHRYNSNNEAFNEIIQKLSDLLLQKAVRRNLRVFQKDIFYDNEEVEITAEVYNQANELTVIPEIRFTLTDENQISRNFNFIPLENNYKLNLGVLNPGKYNYIANTKINNIEYKVNGRFYVEELLLEFSNNVANHNLIDALSKQTNGKLFYPENLADIENYIKTQNCLPVEYLNYKYNDLINIRLFAIIIFILLCIEWALRKYFGYY